MISVNSRERSEFLRKTSRLITYLTPQSPNQCHKNIVNFQTQFLLYTEPEFVVPTKKDTDKICRSMIFVLFGRKMVHSFFEFSLYFRQAYRTRWFCALNFTSYSTLERNQLEGTSLMLGSKEKRERLNVKTQLANSLCSARLRSVRLVLGSCWKTNETLSYLCHFLPSPLCYRPCVNLQKIRKIDVTISRLLVRSSEANKSRP